MFRFHRRCRINAFYLHISTEQIEHITPHCDYLQCSGINMSLSNMGNSIYDVMSCDKTVISNIKQYRTAFLAC